MNAVEKARLPTTLLLTCSTTQRGQYGASPNATICPGCAPSAGCEMTLRPSSWALASNPSTGAPTTISAQNASLRLLAFTNMTEKLTATMTTGVRSTTPKTRVKARLRLDTGRGFFSRDLVDAMPPKQRSQKKSPKKSRGEMPGEGSITAITAQSRLTAQR